MEILKTIDKQIKRLTKEDIDIIERTGVFIYEFEGEEKVVEIDWSLYGGSLEGWNGVQNKRGFIRLKSYLSVIGGKLDSEYVKNTSEIKIRIDDILFESIGASIFQKIKHIIIFKEKIKQEKDVFIKFTKITSDGKIKALIKLENKEKSEITMNKYHTFCNTRREFYAMISLYGFENKTLYKGCTTGIILTSCGCEFETTSRTFGNYVKNTIDIFFGNLENNKNHSFVRWTNYTNGGLVAMLTTTHNGVVKEFEIYIGWYKPNGFLRSEKSFYDYAEKQGDEILTPYVGYEESVMVKFKNCKHNPREVTVSNYKKGQKCLLCSIENRSGEGSFYWKGGVTPLHNYLRRKINQWKYDSFKQTNYKCAITGKGGKNVVHHLVGFSTILFETMDIVGLDIRGNISEYTQEELQLIEEKCIELHYKYGLGVVLTPEIHDEFHSIYGKGNNTPQQFEEFKQMKTSELQSVA